MSKRIRTASIQGALGSDGLSLKRLKGAPYFVPRKVAHAEVAAAVDARPPLSQLLKVAKETESQTEKGRCVVYWMRMGDLRSEISSFFCSL